jgi:1L-myo-inositol 1-phosphate cytidylyltransferase / CDP-L-myo-inositol myo-inositolphosphotransferase
MLCPGLAEGKPTSPMAESLGHAGSQSSSARVAGHPSVGVVLAAGRSERLRLVTRGRSKLLLHLGGLSLVERAVRTLLAAGVQRVVVVVGHQGDAVASAVQRLQPGQVETVEASEWERGNGASLAAAEPALVGQGQFLLLCGDHVFADGALDTLASAGGPAVLVDRSPDRDAWEEGTRVRMRDGHVVAFGKALGEPAIDCGAFLLTPEVFACQKAAAAEGDHSLAGAVTRLASDHPVRAISLPRSSWWQDVDTPHDLRLARGQLRRTLGLEADGPVSRYLNRPVSTRLSMALAPLRLSPTVLSFVAFSLGMLAAFLLAAEHPLLGGLVLHAGSVVDGMDGEAARLQLRPTLRGTWLNGLLNRWVDAAILVGLGIWMAQDTFSDRTILLILGGVGIGWAILAMTGMAWTTVLRVPAAAERLVGLSLGGRDGRLFLVTAWALLGHPMVALVAFLVAWAVSVIVRVVLVVRSVGVEAPTGLT